jgi:hypothetical protein
MAGEAVLIAPVSAPIPCKQGILQGIPRNLAIKGTSAQPKAPMLLAFFPQFPTQASREKNPKSREFAQTSTEYVH